MSPVLTNFPYWNTKSQSSSQLWNMIYYFLLLALRSVKPGESYPLAFPFISVAFITSKNPALLIAGHRQVGGAFPFQNFIGQKEDTPMSARWVSEISFPFSRNLYICWKLILLTFKGMLVLKLTHMDLKATKLQFCHCVSSNISRRWGQPVPLKRQRLLTWDRSLVHICNDTPPFDPGRPL